jgi:hypothetical protein
MKITMPASCKSIARPAAAALAAALLSGCTIGQNLSGYTATATTPDARPDLLPQEAFSAALDANLAQSATALAASEALLARAARLNLWAGNQPSQTVE